MQPPSQPPYGAPPPGNAPPHVSVGGPQGIQLHGTQVYVNGQLVTPPVQAPAHPARVSPHGPHAQAVAPSPEEASRHLQKSLILLGAGLLAAPIWLAGMWGVSMFSAFTAACVVGGAAALGSARAIKRRRDSAPKALAASQEHALMSLAIAHDGELTPTLVAHNLRVSIDEADAMLMKLATQGHVEIRNDERSGVIVYRFSEIWANPDRYRASSGGAHG